MMSPTPSGPMPLRGSASRRPATLDLEVTPRQPATPTAPLISVGEQVQEVLCAALGRAVSLRDQQVACTLVRPEGRSDVQISGRALDSGHPNLTVNVQVAPDLDAVFVDSSTQLRMDRSIPATTRLEETERFARGLARGLASAARAQHLRYVVFETPHSKSLATELRNMGFIPDRRSRWSRLQAHPDLVLDLEDPAKVDFFERRLGGCALVEEKYVPRDQRPRTNPHN